jgi:hypothetical protein
MNEYLANLTENIRCYNKNLLKKSWRRGTVVIATASKSGDGRFKSTQDFTLKVFLKSVHSNSYLNMYC